MRRGNQRKFGRDKKVRVSFYRSLATALVDHGKIKTTTARAKSLSRMIDRLITLAKRDNLNARRELTTRIGEQAVKKLMNEIAKANVNRQGGYTRIIKLGQRRSDGAEMAMIELVREENSTPATK